MRRRNVLKSLGAVGGGIGVGTVTLSSLGRALSNDPSVQVDEYDVGSRDWRTVLYRLGFDREFGLIRDKLNNEGWSLDWRASACGKTSNSEGKYEWAVVPCKENGDRDGDEAYLTWAGNDSMGASLEVNYGAQILEAASDERIASPTKPTFFGFARTTSMYVPNEPVGPQSTSDGPELKVERTDYTKKENTLTLSENIDLESGDDVVVGKDVGNISSHRSPDKCVVQACIWNNALTDTGCVIQTATTLIGTIAGCFSCVLGNVLGCIGCIVSVGGLVYLIDQGCLSHHGCWNTTVYIAEEWLEEKGASCAEYAEGNPNDNRIVLSSLDDVGRINDQYD